MEYSEKQRAWLEIDLTKVAHNVNEMHRILPKHTKIMGIVKDNAYGHGDIEMAKALEACGVDFFGLSTMEEVVRLREAGITSNMMLLSYTPLAYFDDLIQYNVIQTVVSYEHALALQALAKAKNVILPVHIKIDTGMSRVGIRYVEGQKLIHEILGVYALDHLQVEGVFSHFAVSDDLAMDRIAFTQKQIELYDEVIEIIIAAGHKKPMTHLQNSYGILNYPELPYDYVRPGLLHLGVTSDCAVAVHHPLDLQPVLSLKAQISMIKTIEPGSSVSYGCNFIAHHPMKVATVGIGYGDGYPRALSNTFTKVIINGHYCHVIGNICMDQIMIDVTHVECCVEDEVILIGAADHLEVPIDQISEKTKTINNDVLCQLNTRLPRFYKK